MVDSFYAASCPIRTRFARSRHPAGGELNSPDLLTGTLFEIWTGARLREWRESLRLTQADLAHLLVVNRRTVMAWEATPDAPVANTVVLACRYIDEHQDRIGSSFQAENEVARVTAIAKAEAQAG
jgi:DNA-binding XRE family transcriptional regulator